MVLLILQLGALAAVILYCGRNLSRYGDLIAAQTGMGRAWIGMILMATVTSLPELAAGISSVRVLRSADLAVGNVVGSCVFNLFTLSLLDLLNKRKPLFSIASESHTLAAAISIILLSVVGMGLFLPNDIRVANWVGLISLVTAGVYFFSMRILFLNEQKRAAHSALEEKPELINGSLQRTLFLYSINALVVVLAALVLPGIADQLATKLGLSQSIAGTLILAAATTLPEATVSISAIRIGAYDLAVGNLIGSNLFNVVILTVDELFYTEGYLLKDASDVHITSVFTVIIMTAIAIAGLAYRSREKVFFIAWDSLLMAAVYIFNLVLLYLLQ